MLYHILNVIGEKMTKQTKLRAGGHISAYLAVATFIGLVVNEILTRKGVGKPIIGKSLGLAFGLTTLFCITFSSICFKYYHKSLDITQPWQKQDINTSKRDDAIPAVADPVAGEQETSRSLSENASQPGADNSINDDLPSAMNATGATSAQGKDEQKGI